MSKKGKLTFYKYKHLIFAVIIIIIVIILDIILENYSKKSFEKINVNLSKIYKVFESQNEESYNKKELEKLSSNSIKELKKRTNTLSCFIEHEEVEKINIRLKQLNEEIKNEIWGDAKVTLSETKQLIEHLSVKYKFSLQNLF